MLKTLVKKQLFEVFKGYFYDAKRNKMRSKFVIAAWFVFFAVIMVGVLGGMFLALSLTLCGPLISCNAGWFYFVLMGTVAVLLGSFGSVYNSYTALYLSKDNDLLLSLPIPVRNIVGSRLINVYLLGVMYILTVTIPTEIVYFMQTGITGAKVLCGILFFFIISAIVMLISCGLGYVIAKISLRLKNKSFITVFVTLAAVAAYYFFYFKAGDFIRDLLVNAPIYAENVRRYAYPLYLFGLIGEGNIVWCFVFTALFAGACFLLWHHMLKSFISIATASSKVEKIQYVEKTVKEKSPFEALVWKELQKFTSSPTYMLNCGLGIILMPAAGILLLFKGQVIIEAVERVFSDYPGSATAFLCTGLIFMGSMIDTAVPSVSLEGKSIWISHSLPVKPRQVLLSKMTLQIVLAAIPTLIAALCTSMIVDESFICKLLIVIMPMMFALFSAAIDTAIAVKAPLLNWTNEMVPIKQSGGAFLAILSFWGLSILFAAVYMLAGFCFGIVMYLIAWSVLFAVLSILIIVWLCTKGAGIYSELA
ncbi:hypothetical protein [Butyrivibrio sp. AD3002]|uniref:hypothetical protein n=1 Tax=Butyrivibrio sp. AD3002 TaxID=1280670 RepID=UPI0003B6F6DC|nr:hypothetical protein [Butyrivibrio sp. AD3002]